MSVPRPRRLWLPEREEYGGPANGRLSDESAWPAVDGQLEQARYYWIVTVCRDGRPHAGPVWGVWLGGALYWAMSPETMMAKNVARRPRALVHLESARDVVIVEGAVDCPDAPTLPAGVVEAYHVKYDLYQEAGDRGMPYYVLRPETVRSWSASDIRGTGIRWQFD
jgi:hypothetical protein